MGLFTLRGTITAIGQSTFTNGGFNYAYVEFTEADGRRISVRKLSVGNLVSPTIGLGHAGEFFFDKWGIWGVWLWGVKTTDGFVAFERAPFKTVAIGLLLIGVVGLPFLLLGIPFLFFAGLLLSKSLQTGARKRMFYGNDRAEAERLRSREAIRI